MACSTNTNMNNQQSSYVSFFIQTLLEYGRVFDSLVDQFEAYHRTTPKAIEDWEHDLQAGNFPTLQNLIDEKPARDGTHAQLQRLCGDINTMDIQTYGDHIITLNDDGSTHTIRELYDELQADAIDLRKSTQSLETLIEYAVLNSMQTESQKEAAIGLSLKPLLSHEDVNRLIFSNAAEYIYETTMQHYGLINLPLEQQPDLVYLSQRITQTLSQSPYEKIREMSDVMELPLETTEYSMAP